MTAGPNLWTVEGRGACWHAGRKRSVLLSHACVGWLAYAETGRLFLPCQHFFVSCSKDASRPRVPSRPHFPLVFVPFRILSFTGGLGIPAWLRQMEDDPNGASGQDLSMRGACLIVASVEDYGCGSTCMSLRRRIFTGTDARELQSIERVVMQEHGSRKEHRSFAREA